MPGSWVAAVAVAAAALAVWVTLRADFLAYPGWLAAQKADIILGPVLVGLYWLRRRPASRFGPLLIVAGLVGGAPYILQSSSEPVLFAIGILWEGVIYTLTLALILRFPSGRLEGRAERVILAVGGDLLARRLSSRWCCSRRRSPASPRSPPARRPARRTGCSSPPSPRWSLDDRARRPGRGDPRGARRDRAHRVAGRERHAAAAPRAGGRRARRGRLPVSQAAYQTARLLEIEADALYPVVQWTLAGARSSIWYGFLVALIAAELFAGRVLRGVVIESLRRPALGELEAMLREPLGDPGLRLAFRRPDGDGWVDADGEPIAIADPAPGCVLTEVERDGRRGGGDRPRRPARRGARAAAGGGGGRAARAGERAARGRLERLAARAAGLAAPDRRRQRGRAAPARARPPRRRPAAARSSLRIRLAIASEQAAATPSPAPRLGELEGDSTRRSRSCATSRTASSRACSPTAGSCPRCAPSGGAAPRHGRGHRPAHRPLPARDRVGGLLLLPGGAPERDQARRAGGAHRGAPQRRATASSASRSATTAPASTSTAVHDGDGLRNMEDRLGAVHGRLAIVSSPGNGTLISGVVPINGAP